MSKSFEVDSGGEGNSERFVRRPMSSRTSDLYEFGAYRLDAQRRVFTREDRVVPLAPKTFELLLLLVQGEGRAFSKQELMTALWPDTFVEEANLSFQISVLRKALGEADSHWIETVPEARLPAHRRREGDSQPGGPDVRGPHRRDAHRTRTGSELAQSWRGRLIAGVLAVALAGLVTWVWQRMAVPGSTSRATARR